jgi:hypothetical protein
MKSSRQLTYVIKREQLAFSMVEMLFVGSIAFVILSAATLLYGALANRVTPPTTLPTLSDAAAAQIPNAVHQGLYGVGLPANGFQTWTAPNLGLQARADEARDLFHKDVESAVAVFCFARNAPVALAGGVDANENRRLNFTFPLAGPAIGDTPRQSITGLTNYGINTRIDNPDGFHNLLIDPAVAGNNARANTYLAPLQAGNQVTGPNASIFIIGPTPEDLSAADTNIVNPVLSTQSLRVLAIWEVDFIDLTTAEGILASVRRYSNSFLAPAGAINDYALGVPTIEYTVIFSEENSYGVDLQQNSFGPIFKGFTRSTTTQLQAAPVVGTNVPNAVRNPFYVIWWPDPASPNLVPVDSDPAFNNNFRFINAANGGVLQAAALPANRVLAAESLAHYGNTSYLMVAPMFPSLLQ